MAWINLSQQDFFTAPQMGMQKRQIENQAEQAAARQSLAEQQQAAQERQFMVEQALRQQQFGANLADTQQARAQNIQQRLFELGFGEKAAQAGDARSLAGRKEILGMQAEAAGAAEARKQEMEDQMLRTLAQQTVEEEFADRSVADFIDTSKLTKVDPKLINVGDENKYATVGGAMYDRAATLSEAAKGVEAAKAERLAQVQRELQKRLLKDSLGLSPTLSEAQSQAGGLPLSSARVGDFLFREPNAGIAIDFGDE